MTVETTLSRVEEEIANGRLWRAKEILGSSISNYGYSRPILFQLATVLHDMGDKVESGKYFLLSVDSPNETQLSAIELFLSRHPTQGYVELLRNLQSKLRLKKRDDYPTHLKNHLEAMGAPKLLRMDIGDAPPNPTLDRFFLIGCAVTAIATIAFTLIGVGTVISWIREAFS